MIATRLALVALAVATTVTAAPMQSPNPAGFLPFAAQKAADAFFKSRVTPRLERKAGQQEISLPDVDPSNPKCASSEYFAAIMGLQTSCAAELPAFSGTEEQLNGILPTFCGSTCDTDIQKVWSDYGKECFIPGTDFAVLFTMLVESCQSYPECFTEAYLTERTTLTSTTCSTTDMAGIGQLFALQASDSAAVCSSACVTGMADHMTKWAKCFPPESRGTFYLLKSMCTDKGGKLCADQVKAIGGLACSGMKTESTCGATGMQCLWTGSTCVIKTTAAYMAATCTTCLDEYVGGFKYVDPAGHVQLMGMQRLFCAKEGDAYCFPGSNDAIMSGALDATKVMDRSAVQAAVCASTTTERCFRRTGADLMAMATQEAIAKFDACAKTNAGSPKETIKAACGAGLIKQMKDVAATAGLQRFLCVKDNSDKYCIDEVAAIMSETGCLSTACSGTNSATSNDCSTFVTNVQNIGCCAAALDAALRYSPRAPMLPPTTDGTDFTPNKTEVANAQPSHSWYKTIWYSAKAVCSSSFTSSTYQADKETKCTSQAKSGSPNAKTTTVRLVNSYLAASAGLTAFVSHAVVTDLAVALGTSQQFIQNVTLTADGKHTAIGFNLDAPTTTDLAAVSAKFDAVKGSIYWVQTAAVAMKTVGLIDKMPGSVGGTLAQDLNAVSVLDTAEPYPVLETTTAAPASSSSAAVATAVAALLAVATLAF